MAEIGKGDLSTTYPTVIDTDTSQEVDNITKCRKEVVNDLGGIVVNIQTELGVDPQGDLTTVKDFTRQEHDGDGTHGTISGTSFTNATIDDGMTLNPNVWPYFSATSSDVSLSLDTGVATLAEFDKEDFDNNSNYDRSSGVYKFTPTVAGRYIITASVYDSSRSFASGVTLTIHLYEDGSPIHTCVFTDHSASASPLSAQLVTIVETDGTKGYQIYLEQSGADTTINMSDRVYQYFMGCRIS